MSTETRFFVETRTSRSPDDWSRLHHGHRNCADAERDVHQCLKRLEENGDMNFQESGFRVLEYRIVQVNTTVEVKPVKRFSAEHTINKKLQRVKEEELHFINQVVRNIKHLEHIYTVGPLANSKELFGVQNSLNNWTLRKSLAERFFIENGHDKDLEEWRTFDQS